MKQSLKCLLVSLWFSLLSAAFASMAFFTKDALSIVLSLVTAMFLVIPIALNVVGYKLADLEEKHSINHKDSTTEGQ